MRLITLFTALLCSIEAISQSKLTKYQKEVLNENVLSSKAEADVFVKVNFYAPNNASNVIELKTAATPKTVFDLKDKGQKAYFEAIKHHTKSLDEFVKGAKESLSKAKRTSKLYEVKKTTFVKKFEIDVRDMLSASKRFGRISELYIYLRLPNNNRIKFKGFQNIVTKYEVVDFGKIGLTRNRNFSLNSGINIAGTGSTISSDTNTINKKLVIDGDTISVSDVGASGNTSGISNTSNLGVTFTSGRTITEELSLRKRRIAMKGTVGSIEASLYQEGYPEINLNDKITIELLFEASDNNVTSDPTFKFSGLFTSSNTANRDPTKLGINFHYLTLPINNVSPITADLSYEFVYREVKNTKGINTPGEWDDKIDFNKLIDKTKVSNTVNFLDVNELKAESWILSNSSGESLWIDYFGVDYQLKFYSLKDVMDLLLWLNETNSTNFKSFQFKKGTAVGGKTNIAVSDIAGFRSKKI